MLRLDPGGRVTGVVRRPDGTPADGARVGVIGCVGGQFTTGPDGRYAIDGLSFGDSHELAATLQDFAPARARAPVVVSRDAPETTCDLVLRVTAALVVTVVDEAGKPVPDAHVQLCDGTNYVKLLQPNPDGSPIEGLEGATLTVYVWADGRSLASRTVELLDGETARIR